MPIIEIPPFNSVGYKESIARFSKDAGDGKPSTGPQPVLQTGAADGKTTRHLSFQSGTRKTKQ
jgi:hypothetical protein